MPMAELRDVAQSLGASDVSTYIASGNLFCVPPGDPAEFDRALESAIETRYGYFREVISRSIDEKLNYLYPLTGTPEPEKVQALVAKPFDDTRIEVIGADLHIRYGVGVAASKLTPPLIARTLGVTGTGRNWRTVGKLIELAG